jgi:ubiquinone/menaquinone biosynthesis C-methylase UbiE
MEAKLQRRIQRYGWDAAAQIYDAIWRENLLPAHDAMFEMAVLKPGECVHDVACGSGFVTFRAADQVCKSGSVLATDISEEMVKLVQKKAEASGLERVTAERMSAESLALPDNSFDVAFCGLGLMYMPEPLDALKEIQRTLKPGGRVVVAVWGARRNCGWAEIFPIVDRVVQSEVCPLFFALGTGDALANDFEKAGLTSVDTRRTSAVLDFEREADVLAAKIDGGPVALAAKRFDADTRKQVEEEFLASIAAYRHGCVFKIPGEFVVAIGRKP